MPTKTYTTTQGQAWDQIARERLGSELRMHELLASNWQQRGTLLFAGDVPVDVPAEAAPRVKTPQTALPPWKR